MQGRSKHDFAFIRLATHNFVQRLFFQGKQSLDLRSTFRNHRPGEKEPETFDVLMKNKFLHAAVISITSDNWIRGAMD